jgi:hypothetical protein
MIGDSFFYKEEVFKTGDLISCNWENTTIEEVKIYVCSEWEKQQVTRYHNNFIVIMFVCNNIINHYTRPYIPDYLGYKYLIGTGFKRDTPECDNAWSDGIFNIKKILIKDHLSYTINQMIANDKKAIEKGALKL